jgi:phosphatidylglycerophosphatase A
MSEKSRSFFDILKPWPIRVLDRKVRGGLGIMLDDLLAGAMTWLLLQTGVRVLGCLGTVQ